MRPDRSLLVVIAVMSLSAGIAVGFALLATLDRSEETFPTARTAVVVLDVPTDVDITRLLRDRAAQDHVDFYRVQADPHRTGRRIVEPVIGDQSAHERVFHDGRYRGGAAEQTVVLGGPQGSGRGVYFSTASPAQAAAFVSELRSAGVDARVDPAGWRTVLVFTAGRPGVALAMGASFVAVGLLGRVSGVSTARRLGVAEVLGVPRVRTAEVARVLCGQTAVALVALAIGSLAARAMVGAQLPSVLAIAGCVWGVYAVLFVGASMTGWSRHAATRMRAGWSGWRPRAGSTCSTSMLRVAAIASISLAAGPLADSVVLLEQYHRAGEMRIDCARCTTPLLAGTLQPDEIEAAAPAFARLFDAVDDGRSVLASHPVVPLDQSVEPDVGNTLVVNREYLDRVGQPLTDPWPDRPSLDPGEWAVFVPADSTLSAEAVVAKWSAWFAFQREVDPALAGARTPLVIEYAPRSVFTFGAATDEAPLFAEAPVIAVVSASSHLVSGDFLTAAASNGQFLLDVGDPERLLATAGLAAVIGSVHSWAAVSAAHRDGVIRTALAEAIAAVLALVVAALVVAIRVDVIRSSESARLRESARLGVGLLRTHARNFVIEGIVLVTSVAAAASLPARGVASAPALLVGVAVALATAAVVLVTVRMTGDGGDEDVA